MATIAEVWSGCAIDASWAHGCRHCYSGLFVTWNAIFAFLWMYDLYLYVLMVSRGFRVHLLHLNCMWEDNKNIPAAALNIFTGLTLAIAAWIVVGIVFLIDSNRCEADPLVGEWHFHDRSPLMFNTTIFGVFLGICLPLWGRCALV